MWYVLIIIAGGFVGAISFAQFVVRWRRGYSLYEQGSTNVGAKNAFVTTGSKKIGGVVLALDLVKGIAAVLAGWLIAREAGIAESLEHARTLFWPGAASLLAALATHNFHPVLSLKARRIVGGKGFATAAGGFLLLTPLLVPLWLCLVLIGVKGFELWKGVRSVIPGNVFATSLTPLPAYELYGMDAMLAVVAFAVMTLPKHVRQMRNLFRGYPSDQQFATPILNDELHHGLSEQKSVNDATSDNLGV
ncbi:MAG: glycerol-3-phosphate acyltransferase [Rubricoccaceae bacterium]|nr:glycerol-3-phosphate acyltransferase [Rubricoccaceae bacterium]